MILRYAKYLDLPFFHVIHIAIVWIIKTPFDVFTWQPLRPLKTDPGQRMERGFLSFTGRQVETQSSSDGTSRGTWFSLTALCWALPSQWFSVSVCQGTLTPACWSLMEKGVPSAVSPLSTWRVHRSPIQTHKPWVHHCCVSAGKQEAMEP